MDFTHDRRVGQKVRALRIGKDWTQERLCIELQTCGCDMTRSTLAKIEAGKRHIYVHEIAALKQALGLQSYDELFE